MAYSCKMNRQSWLYMEKECAYLFPRQALRDTRRSRRYSQTTRVAFIYHKARFVNVEILTTFNTSGKLTIMRARARAWKLKPNANRASRDNGSQSFRLQRARSISRRSNHRETFLPRFLLLFLASGKGKRGFSGELLGHRQSGPAFVPKLCYNRGPELKP